MLKARKIKIKKSFTLIESLVFLFIFSLAVLTFYKAMTDGMTSIIDAKSRLGAVALANERMEIIRNLSYDQIGTQGGIPNGNIPQGETGIIKSGISFNIHTSVVYIDDDTDDIAVALGGSDTRPDDYKRVTVSVSWGDGGASRTADLTSFFSPPGIEEVFTGGILSIKVVDNTLIQGIAGLSVHIVNNDVSPSINTTETTDADGKVVLLNYPISDSYSLEISKSGYYTVQTYESDSSMIARELPASVLSGAINPRTLITDVVSTINLVTEDPLGNSIPNISFDLKGGKQIGDTVASPSEPVYDFNETGQSSGSSGEKTFSNRIFGSYFFTFTNPTDDYEFLKMDPSVTTRDKFGILPGNNDIAAIFMDKNVNSLLVTVSDSTDGTLINGATVELKNTALSYGPITLTTDQYGQAYFPDSSGPLTTDSGYELKVSADGYSDNTKTNLTIDKLTKEDVSL